MRLKFHKEIEFFLKKIFFSQSFLFKRRLERAIKNNEENEIELVKKFSDKNYDSIDIGVYRGVYTYEMSKYSKIVHSFEANPILFNNLKKNFSKLRNNIIIYNYALSSQNEKVELKIPLRNPNSNKNNYEEYYKLGTATIHKDNKIMNYEKVIVDSKKLDDCEFKNKISLIKIDVEGHEIPVIKGGIKTISRNKPALIVEIDENHSKQKVSSTISFINSLGYKSNYYQDGLIKSTDELDDFKKYSNFIFLPH